MICDRITEAKIDIIREEFLENMIGIVCDYLAHVVTKYRRTERPPMLQHFITHTKETPVWQNKDLPIKFRDKISQQIHIDNVALKMVQLKCNLHITAVTRQL